MSITEGSFTGDFSESKASSTLDDTDAFEVEDHLENRLPAG